MRSICRKRVFDISAQRQDAEHRPRPTIARLLPDLRPFCRAALECVRVGIFVARTINCCVLGSASTDGVAAKGRSANSVLIADWAVKGSTRWSGNTSTSRCSGYELRQRLAEHVMLFRFGDGQDLVVGQVHLQFDFRRFVHQQRAQGLHGRIAVESFQRVRLPAWPWDVPRSPCRYP